jgi:hypothetical protein
MIPALLALLPAGAAFAQCPDITLGPTELPNAIQNSGYERAMTQTGGAAPGSWSAQSLPPGMSLNTGGTILGTPTAGGTFAPRFVFTDANGCAASLFLPLTVIPTAPQPVIDILRTTIDEPATQSLLDTMSITDIDSTAMTATLSVDDGTLTVAAGTNAVTVTGSTTDTVTLVGNLVDINALFSGDNGGTVDFVSGGARFASTLLTLEADDGAETGTATSIVSGPTVLGPRVWVVAPSSTRQLAISSLNAQGATVDGSPYNYSSSDPAVIGISNSGLISTNTSLTFAQLTVESTGRRLARPWIAANNVVAVNVGTNLPSSIASSDGDSAFGSNQFLPSSSYYSDVYTIALTMGQAVTIKLDSGDDLDTYLTLADADGWPLDVNDDDDTGALGVGSRLDFVAPATGTYVIEASTFNGSDAGAYTLIIDNGGPPPAPSAATPLRTQQRIKR